TGGVLTLSGANTYTGTTTVSQGTISASNIVVSGGSSNLGNSATPIALGGVGSTGILSYTGGNATYTRGLTLAASGTGELDVTLAATNLLVNSVIAGSGNFIKGGSGTLTLTGANTYSGKTSIANGVVSVSSLNSVSGGSASSNLGAPTTPANGTIDFGGG